MKEPRSLSGSELESLAAKPQAAGKPVTVVAIEADTIVIRADWCGVSYINAIVRPFRARQATASGSRT